MSAMTTHEFDMMLAALSFALEQAIEDPPIHFDADRIEDLQDAVEDLRLSALENEANARVAVPDLDSAVMRWINLMGRYGASNE